MKLGVKFNIPHKNPLLRDLKFSPTVNRVLLQLFCQSVTPAGTRSSEKCGGREAFISNLQCSSCLPPSSPLSVSAPSPSSLSADETSYCSLKFLLLQTSQAARSPVFPLFVQIRRLDGWGVRGGGLSGWGPQATCSQVMHMTYCTYMRRLLTCSRAVLVVQHVHVCGPWINRFFRAAGTERSQRKKINMWRSG